MQIAYTTNGVVTTTSLTEWYFGKKFVMRCTASAIRSHEKGGASSVKFWQDGTGYLTVCIH